jgi:Ca2+-binding RTX toxin-like protein
VPIRDAFVAGGGQCAATGKRTMAFDITGTPNNDTILTPSNQGDGTVRGLAGDDRIEVPFRAPISAQLFGGAGSDSIRTLEILSVTMVGGDSSLDGNDSLVVDGGASGTCFIFGNGGSDTIFGLLAFSTVVGGFGNDSVLINNGEQNTLIFANEGNDTLDLSGSDFNTIFGGQGNDSVRSTTAGGQFRLNENNDTFYADGNSSALTVTGGNDSADGADSIWTGSGNDVVLGNGGNDTILGGEGNNVLVGAGADFVFSGDDLDFIFGNENNDTLISGKGPDTVFGGQGNDSIVTGLVLSDDGFGNDSILGNEGSDRIIAGTGADTISGGADADVFIYEDPGDDGSSGGSVEFITDLSWAVDSFAFAWSVEFAAVTSPGGAGNLGQAAANALLAAWQQNGSADVNVAAVFTFQGRTYLVSDSNLTHNGAFSNNDDILIDITAATGSVNANALNAL